MHVDHMESDFGTNERSVIKIQIQKPFSCVQGYLLFHGVIDMKCQKMKKKTDPQIITSLVLCQRLDNIHIVSGKILVSHGPYIKFTSVSTFTIAI